MKRFNQALFEKIRVYEDLTFDVEYAEPFETLLNPAMFELKHEFEKDMENIIDEQSEPTAHHSFSDVFCDLKTKTSLKISNFFSAGFCFDLLVREMGFEPTHP